MVGLPQWQMSSEVVQKFGESQTQTLPDGSTIEMGEQAGLLPRSCSCAVQCQNFGMLPIPSLLRY